MAARTGEKMQTSEWRGGTRAAGLEWERMGASPRRWSVLPSQQSPAPRVHRRCVGPGVASSPVAGRTFPEQPEDRRARWDVLTTSLPYYFCPRLSACLYSDLQTQVPIIAKGCLGSTHTPVLPSTQAPWIRAYSSLSGGRLIQGHGRCAHRAVKT